MIHLSCTGGAWLNINACPLSHQRVHVHVAIVLCTRKLFYIIICTYTVLVPARLAVFTVGNECSMQLIVAAHYKSHSTKCHMC